MATALLSDDDAAVPKQHFIMTVSYSNKIMTANRLGAFSKLMIMWKGSVYKLVWADLLAYLTLYFSISASYRFVLDVEQKRHFEAAAMFCDRHSSLIPISFVLAFYVSHVVSRWWAQWNAIPWPDGLAFKINSYCSGLDENTRLVRRTVTRYACLAIVETLRLVSSPVKKRFPTYNHLVEAGLLTEEEKQALLSAECKSEYMNYIYWVPLTWASSLTMEAYRHGYIGKASLAAEVNSELNKLRISCGTVISFDWVSLPLVYTQVVTLAVYTFFGTTLLGRQWLDPNTQIEGYLSKNIDYVIPIFTILQFIFYIGWLKVAEALLNPYGEDDEDFDTNWMVDRHLQLSYMMVDVVGQHPPKMEKDPHWDVSIPEELPYTVASLPFRTPPAQTSAELLSIPIKEQQPIYPQYLESNDPKTLNNSTWRLNLAISNLMTPMVKRRSRSRKVSSISTHSMPFPDSNAARSRRKVRRNPTSSSLSPYFARRNNLELMRARTPSIESIIGCTSTETRSRKASAKSFCQLKPVLEEASAPNEIRIVVPRISRTSPPKCDDISKDKEVGNTEIV